MKKNQLLTLLISLFWVQSLFAQNPPLNCSGLGQLTYPNRLSNIWGYKDTSGVEYALVGVYDGVSIVDVSNPTTPIQAAFIAGGSTIWRELKTWDKYMYVVSEMVNEGVLIADLSMLPATLNYQYKYLTVGPDTVKNAHTLYIDESGYLYLAGSNLAGGAPLIFNLNPNPQNPVYVGTVGIDYAHDIYVRNDTLWGSHVYDGWFSVFDINNRANPILLATQNTSSNFTHNAWLSDDSRTLFTTDERASAYVDAYDVSDLSDIKLLDKWRYPVGSEQSPIPHNVHVLDDYLVVSYYTEGVVVLDAKHPDNLVEVAHYDTYPLLGNGFSGCWGVYPYLPSGIVIASDINTGLHVLSPVYQRACRLQGQVTALSNGLPIFDVEVEILNANIIKNTKLDGTYKSGIHSGGTYQVRFRKAGYVPETRSVQLFNDSIVVLNVALQTAVPFAAQGRVVEADAPSLGVAAAQVKYAHSADFFEYDTTCNTSGDYTMQVQEEEYYLIAGKWGYRTSQTLAYINAASNPILTIDSAIYDDFAFDFGWTVSGTIDTGAWERVRPAAGYDWAGMLPKDDITNDIDKQCYITGVSQSRSDAGYSVLTSPSFDASALSDPHLSFYYWFTSFDSTYAINNDTLQVWVNNGSVDVKIAQYFNGLYNWSPQKIYRLTDYIALTNNMRVSFRVNNSHARNYQEAGIDKFQVDEFEVLTNVENIGSLENNFVSLRAYPIPFGEKTLIEYEVLNFNNTKPEYLIIYNVYGQVIEQQKITNSMGSIEIGATWPAGVYFVHLAGKNLKLVKH